MKAVLVVSVVIGALALPVTAFTSEVLFAMTCSLCGGGTIELYSSNRDWLIYAVPLGAGIVAFSSFVVPITALVLLVRTVRSIGRAA